MKTFKERLLLKLTRIHRNVFFLFVTEKEKPPDHRLNKYWPFPLLPTRHRVTFVVARATVSKQIRVFIRYGTIAADIPHFGQFIESNIYEIYIVNSWLPVWIKFHRTDKHCFIPMLILSAACLLIPSCSKLYAI